MPTRSFFLRHAALAASMLCFGYFALSLADGTYQHQDRVAQETFKAAPRGISMAAR